MLQNYYLCRVSRGYNFPTDTRFDRTFISHALGESSYEEVTNANHSDL